MIEVRGLTKRYGDVVAVDDVSFDVEQGLVTGFLGPNGAGKSTTMRLVLGLKLGLIAGNEAAGDVVPPVGERPGSHRPSPLSRPSSRCWRWR